MNYIINSDQLLYLNLEDYLAAIRAGETGDVYLLLFAYDIDDIFEKVKRRAAMRARFSKDDQGRSQMDVISVSEDERDLYLDWLRTESAKIFREISGFSKDIASAFRFNAKFGDPEFAGTISSVEIDNVTLNDLAQTMTVNAYANMKLVITTPGLMENIERTIVSNTATAFVVDQAFPGDVTGLEYAVIAQTNDYILIYASMDSFKFDVNVLTGQDALFEKAFIESILKEWYLLNRMMDDYRIEASKLKETISDLRMHFFQSRVAYRADQFMADPDVGTV